MKTHRKFSEWFELANGARTPAIERQIHVSRSCSNCSANGRYDPDWVAGGGIEEFGTCMNLCSAADDADEANQWCSAHQTPAELRANVSRIDRPVFVLTVVE